MVQDISRKQSSTDEGVVKGVLDLLATINARRSNISHPLAVITRHLCHLIGLAEEELKLVKEEHANAVTILVCTRLRETLDRLNLIIQRLKCERLMLPYIVNADRDILENEIKQKERGLCDAASKLVNVAVLLSSMAVDADFEKLVRTVGRSLAANVQTFVMHVEGKLRERYEQMETKKRFNAVAAQKRVIRESDCVARTIFGMETFSKTIIQLSAKTKASYILYIFFISSVLIIGLM
ncbi:hypothetical protein B566_EDAN016932 [Ephemera danica]|nr:hypothetical protein B566_EDAN016932 [Ephemera danica]